MQVGNFINLLRATLEDATEYTWQDADLLAWAQLGLNDIAFRTRAYREEKQFECIPNEHKYSLDAHIIKIDKLYIGNNEATFSDWQPKAGTGTPNSYAYDNGSLYLYPTPNNRYLVTAWAYTVPIMPTGTDDEVPLPLFTDALRSFVLHKAYEQLDQTDIAGYHHQLYANELDKHSMANRRQRASLTTTINETY